MDGEAAAFTRLLDQGLTADVARAAWSPTMDLLVLGFGDGQLCLHRLNWQRLWAVTPERPLTALCWRPDGKALAAGAEARRRAAHKRPAPLLALVLRQAGAGASSAHCAAQDWAPAARSGAGWGWRVLGRRANGGAPQAQQGCSADARVGKPLTGARAGRQHSGAGRGKWRAAAAAAAGDGPDRVPGLGGGGGWERRPRRPRQPAARGRRRALLRRPGRAAAGAGPAAAAGARTFVLGHMTPASAHQSGRQRGVRALRAATR